jgi:hypothetical protein
VKKTPKNGGLGVTNKGEEYFTAKGIDISEPFLDEILRNRHFSDKDDFINKMTDTMKKRKINSKGRIKNDDDRKFEIKDMFSLFNDNLESTQFSK